MQSVTPMRLRRSSNQWTRKGRRSQCLLLRFFSGNQLIRVATKWHVSGLCQMLICMQFKWEIRKQMAEFAFWQKSTNAAWGKSRDKKLPPWGPAYKTDLNLKTFCLGSSPLTLKNYAGSSLRIFFFSFLFSFHLQAYFHLKLSTG